MAVNLEISSQPLQFVLVENIEVASRVSICPASRGGVNLGCWPCVTCRVVRFLPQLICFCGPPSGLPGTVAGLSGQSVGFIICMPSSLLSRFGGAVGEAPG